MVDRQSLRLRPGNVQEAGKQVRFTFFALAAAPCSDAVLCKPTYAQGLTFTKQAFSMHACTLLIFNKFCFLLLIRIYPSLLCDCTADTHCGTFMTQHVTQYNPQSFFQLMGRRHRHKANSPGMY